MSELLTTKQLLELLKVDRITVYRMLNDGRLKGVKIGNQWRFPKEEIDRLLGKNEQNNETEHDEEPLTDFPSDCVQRVQEIFAGIIGIGAIIIDLKGRAITSPTFSNPFCKLMLSSSTGLPACQESWRKIALRVSGAPSFQICHAGLCYQRSIINLGDQPVAWLVAGQFYISSPNLEKLNDRLKNLSTRHNIPLAQLTEAAQRIPVLRRYQQEQVQEWTPRVANTIQSILCERSEIMSRLQRIAELSTIHTTLSK